MHFEPAMGLTLAPDIKKLLRIVKLTTIIVLMACLMASAKGFTQTFNLDVTNAPLTHVFKEIEKQTGYSFVYASNLNEKGRSITLHLRNVTIDEALKKCFEGQPFTYKIINKVIIVNTKEEKNPNPDATDVTVLALIDISGKVMDADGNPLPGANVKIKGSDKGTTTNSDGVFFLKGVDAHATLEISYIGYQTATIGVNNKTVIISSLKLNISTNEEVIINKGYYTEKQRTSVSNVATVTAKDIEKQPVQNPLLALQGRVPGLTVLQTSGIAGSSVKVRIQGQNSIANGNEPLYVIDGVPVISELPRTGLDRVLGPTGANFSGYGNPLSYLNSSDIESIVVLKDADATAIYGSRGANGVILITTKKGKAGPMRLDVDLQTGFGQVAHQLNMLDTRQYLDMRYEAFRNDGIDWEDPSVLADDLKVWDTTRYTDWQKELIGGTAHYTNINTSISGGTSTLRYLVGATYHKETTVFPFPSDFADLKGSVHFNLNANSANQKFKMQFSGSYLYDLNQLPMVDLTPAALLLEPDAPALYKTDGSLNWAPDASGRSTFPDNPMLALYNKYRNTTTNLLGSLLLNYQILPGLAISNRIGYNVVQTNDFSPSPLIAVKPENRSTTQRSAGYGDRDINSWTIEPQVSYSKSIHANSIELLAGSTFLNLNTHSGYLFGTGYLSDEMLENINAASNLVSAIASQSQYKYSAVFARANFTFSDKYVINLTARRDGSSRFGGANRFHNFGSVGAGWLFSREEFFRKHWRFLSFGKLRASYGTTGSDQIGDYKFLSLYGLYPGIGAPYQGTSSIIPSGLPNPYLQWEETKKLQIGTDLSFLQDRIVLNATYVRNTSSNQLLPYSLPSITGFGGYLSNFPATIENQNWEVSIHTVNIKQKKFSWVSSINLTIPHNQLVAFPNLSNSTYSNQLVIGQPISVKRVVHFLSVDPTTGNYMFASKTDPFNPKFPDDYTTLINIDPKFYGGLQNTCTYKQFEVDFLFQYVKQIGYNDALFWNGSLVPGSFYPGVSNQPDYVLNRWQHPGDVTNISRFTTAGGFPSTISSDYRYSDASYIRLKNVSLSWELPEKWVSKVRFKNCKVYIHGQNLLTLTNYKGLDPENQSILTPYLPPLRVVTIGIQIGL